MSYSVEFTAAGLESLEEISPTNQKRVLRKIRWLSENLDDITPQALKADLSGLFNPDFSQRFSEVA
ncbi:MAG: hypothetical protein MUF49_20765 [Oculatellaceae cyanobacterium Prado106]|jgi:mRNA interferase RelE/StbE|nr:hypothetical protein [Oculatellaceae cyanobacterium Prado106]